ncbi:MAG: hypothetical protein ACM3SR_14625 [Ignavibacteriales bacterium]
MSPKVELHIVIDHDGIRGVQIIGPSETHLQGHDLYFNIRDLVLEFDMAVQKRLKEKEDNNFERGKEH